MSHKRIRTYLFVVSITLAALGCLFLVAASPFALNSLLRFQPNWAQLSNIGQTYGAISALLAAIGLSGVAATVAVQIRESRRSRLDSIRSRHYELYKAALEDPDLMDTAYDSIQMPSRRLRKQAIFINMQLQFWLMLWEIDELSESSLRYQVTNLLKTQAGKDYWERFGLTIESTFAAKREERKFYQIVAEEHQRLALTNQENPPGITNRIARHIRHSVIASMLGGLAAGTALGISVATRVIRAKSNRPGRR